MTIAIEAYCHQDQYQISLHPHLRGYWAYQGIRNLYTEGNQFVYSDACTIQLLAEGQFYCPAYAKPERRIYIHTSPVEEEAVLSVIRQPLIQGSVILRGESAVVVYRLVQSFTESDSPDSR